MNIIVINTDTGATTRCDAETAGELTTMGREQIEWAIEEFGRADCEPWVVIPIEPLDWQVGGRR